MSLAKYRLQSLRDKHDALTNEELRQETERLKEDIKEVKTVESKKRKKNKKYE